MPDNYTAPDELMREIYLAIYAALESRLHLIGSVIDAESRKEILAQQFVDTNISWMVFLIDYFVL